MARAGGGCWFAAGLLLVCCWFAAGLLLVTAGCGWTDLDGKATVHCSFKNESLEPPEDGMTVLPGVSWFRLRGRLWKI